MKVHKWESSHLFLNINIFSDFEIGSAQMLTELKDYFVNYLFKISQYKYHSSIFYPIHLPLQFRSFFRYLVNAEHNITFCFIFDWYRLSVLSFSCCYLNVIIVFFKKFGEYIVKIRVGGGLIIIVKIEENIFYLLYFFWFILCFLKNKIKL